MRSWWLYRFHQSLCMTVVASAILGAQIVQWSHGSIAWWPWLPITGMGVCQWMFITAGAGRRTGSGT